MAWAWPTSALLAAPFEEGRRKGLVFTGKAGDPVLAAADGRVVYATMQHGPHILEPESLDQCAEVFHRNALGFPDVDTAKKGYVIVHR